MGADETKQYRTVFLSVFSYVYCLICVPRSVRYLTDESLMSLWCSLAGSNYFIIDVYLTKDKLGAAQLFHYPQLPLPTSNDASLIQSQDILSRMNLGSLDVEKNRRLKIPKHLGLVECWGLINPVIAREIGGGVYTPVPYLTETSAYKISNIFVRDQSTTGCYGAVQKSYKVIGPVNKFTTANDWRVRQLPTIKTTPDFLDFKVRIGSGDNDITFRGYDYHQLRISELMKPIQNLKMKKDSHEDLGNVDHFGLINCVAETKSFEIRINTKDSSRIFSVGSGIHTILFGYQICHMDPTGVVISVSNGRPSSKVRWLSLRPESEDLPLWNPEEWNVKYF